MKYPCAPFHGKDLFTGLLGDDLVLRPTVDVQTARFCEREGDFVSKTCELWTEQATAESNLLDVGELLLVLASGPGPGMQPKSREDTSSVQNECS